MIDKWEKSDKLDPIIHPEAGVEIQKCFYISVPYFPGLSESYKKIFKYTPIQVCFKGVNTLKSLLIHPKDKISTNQKKDIVYHWECQADGCNSSYIRETSRALGKRVKEHSKSTTSAILARGFVRYKGEKGNFNSSHLYLLIHTSIWCHRKYPGQGTKIARG